MILWGDEVQIYVNKWRIMKFKGIKCVVLFLSYLHILTRLTLKTLQLVKVYLLYLIYLYLVRSCPILHRYIVLARRRGTYLCAHCWGQCLKSAQKFDSFGFRGTSVVPELYPYSAQTSVQPYSNKWYLSHWFMVSIMCWCVSQVQGILLSVQLFP